MQPGSTEQVIYDFIQSDSMRRGYWSAQIKEIHLSFQDKNDAADELESRLLTFYNPLGNGPNASEILQLVGHIEIMTCWWSAIAFKMMGRDLEKELRLGDARQSEHQPFIAQGAEEDRGFTHSKACAGSSADNTGTDARNGADHRVPMSDAARHAIVEAFIQNHMDHVTKVGDAFLRDSQNKEKYKKALLYIWGSSFGVATTVVVLLMGSITALSSGDAVIMIFFLTLIIGFIPYAISGWVFDQTSMF